MLAGFGVEIGGFEGGCGVGWDGECDRSASLGVLMSPRCELVSTAQEKQNDGPLTSTAVRGESLGGIVSRAELLSC